MIQRAERVNHLQRIEQILEPLAFDTACARSYGLVVAAAAARGRSFRGRIADMLIAATAHANRLDLYTRNGDDFAGLDGVIRVVAV